MKQKQINVDNPDWVNNWADLIIKTWPELETLNRYNVVLSLNSDLLNPGDPCNIYGYCDDFQEFKAFMMTLTDSIKIGLIIRICVYNNNGSLICGMDTLNLLN